MATTTLVCKQCNFENEPERVYCHNCGAKLDRSLLPPEATKRADPVVVQERVRRLVSPRRGSGTRWFRNLLLSSAVAAFLALLLVMAKPPDDIPEISKDAETTAPEITSDMEGLVAQPQAGRVVYSEDQVNAFLQSTIKAKPAGSTGFTPLKFERAFVRFDEGAIRITYVQSVFGFPLYATTVDTVTIANGQAVGVPVAGGFGRVKIASKLMPYLGGLFSPLWKVLERDKALIAKMDSVAFHKKTPERPATVELTNRTGGR